MDRRNFIVRAAAAVAAAVAGPKALRALGREDVGAEKAIEPGPSVGAGPLRAVVLILGDRVYSPRTRQWFVVTDFDRSQRTWTLRTIPFRRGMNLIVVTYGGVVEDERGRLFLNPSLPIPPYLV